MVHIPRDAGHYEPPEAKPIQELGMQDGIIYQLYVIVILICFHAVYRLDEEELIMTSMSFGVHFISRGWTRVL